MIGTLQGRVALVTGSSAGIGRAIGEALAVQGASVVAHGHDPDSVAATAKDWRENGWRVGISCADLAQADGPRTLIDDVDKAFGAPDILVLNASIEIVEEWRTATDEAVARQLAVNLNANLALVRSLLPAMLTRGWGRIVAIGSIQEERPNARHLVYAATKTAMTSVILNLARNEHASEVTFNVVRPGAIETDRNRIALSDPAYHQAVLERIPLGRLGKPEDCASVVAMLCSDAGSYINGAVIAVDGGMRL